VEARWLEATVGERGELVLENLPFQPGEAVEVLIVSRRAPSPGQGTGLRDSVLEYREPFDPVASEDWETLR